MLIAYPRYSKTVRCAIKPPIFSKSDTHGSGFLSCESERILCCTDRSTTRAPGQPATLFDSPAAALALALPRPTSPNAGQTATARTEHEPSGCVQHIARHKAPPTKHLVTGTEALGTSQIWPGPPPPSHMSTAITAGRASAHGRTDEPCHGMPPRGPRAR